MPAVPSLVKLAAQLGSDRVIVTQGHARVAAARRLGLPIPAALTDAQGKSRPAVLIP